MNNVDITNKLNTSINGDLKKLVHLNRAAKMLGYRPNTFTVLLSRGGITLERYWIKNLAYFLEDDIKTLKVIHRIGKKSRPKSISLPKRLV